jgi:hypothetical protein
MTSAITAWALMPSTLARPVIIPHGEPILTDAAARIRAAVAEARRD